LLENAQPIELLHCLNDPRNDSPLPGADPIFKKIFACINIKTIQLFNISKINMALARMDKLVKKLMSNPEG
jgi:hypothetical protein